MPPKRAQRATSTSRPSATSKPASPRKAPIAAVAKSIPVPSSPGVLGELKKPAEFFAITIIALGIEAMANALLVGYVGGPELGAVHKKLENVWDIGFLVLWKVLSLFIGWSEGYDDSTMAYFTLLTHLPIPHLLYTFYNISALPLLVNITSTTVAAKIAFALVQPRKKLVAVEPSVSASTQLTSSLLAASLYALPVSISLITWLPTFMLGYFDAVPSVMQAHETSFFGTALLFAVIGAGWAGQSFLLTGPVEAAASKVWNPSEIAAETRRKEARETFDPATATLGETLRYNLHSLLFWQDLGPQGRETLQRLVVLAAWTTINAAVVAGLEIDGVVGKQGFATSEWLKQAVGYGQSEAQKIVARANKGQSLEVWYGALGWASCWGAGALLSGLGLGWVGDVWSG